MYWHAFCYQTISTKGILAVVAIFVLGTTLAIASTVEDVQEKTTASKRTKRLVVVMTNELGN
jgi:hypothetical protein